MLTITLIAFALFLTVSDTFREVVRSILVVVVGFFVYFFAFIFAPEWAWRHNSKLSILIPVNRKIN
jgi:hypothetical protein